MGVGAEGLLRQRQLQRFVHGLGDLIVAGAHMQGQQRDELRAELRLAAPVLAQARQRGVMQRLAAVCATSTHHAR